MLQFFVWHFCIMTVCLTKDIDITDLHLKSFDWLMCICIHKCFCISDLSDKRLNRTHKSHRKLQDCMFNIIFYFALNQVQENNLSIFLICTPPNMHTILFQLFGFSTTCGQKNDEHQNEYGMNSSSWTNKQGYCSM